MALYRYRDVQHNSIATSILQSVRATFVLARHDLESKLVYEPIEIVDRGRTYTVGDIIRLTEYEQGQNVRVLLPEEAA
jgi:hypothetical protein